MSNWPPSTAITDKLLVRMHIYNVAISVWSNVTCPVFENLCVTKTKMVNDEEETENQPIFSSLLTINFALDGLYFT